MCLHMFSYYPRMNDMYMCGSINDPSAWAKKMNVSTYVSDYINYSFVCFFLYFFRLPDNNTVKQWLLDLKWTPELAVQWQEFY